MFYDSHRDALRQRYLESWQRHQQGLPLTPLQAQIVDVIREHPEYQAQIEDPEGLQHAYAVEDGQVNPFLHLGLHLAIREQVQTRRPAGIEQVHLRLAQRLGDAHQAEHRMIDVLAETLWEAQRANIAPDEQRYLERMRQL
jgi:hypothetical protein